MSKKSPAPQRFWHSTGGLDVLPSIEQVVQQLHVSKKIEVKLHELNTRLADDWWSYDAVWMTRDGARIRARISLYDVRPGDPRKDTPSDPRNYRPDVDPKSGFFHVYAEADRAWDPSWPSPLALFVPRVMKPGYGKMGFCRANIFFPPNWNKVDELVADLANLSFLAAVFVNEDETRKGHEKILPHGETPLTSRLPTSLYGRIVEIRIVSEAIRTRLNKYLSRYKVQLPAGGAAILLDSRRRRNLQQSDLEFSPAPMAPPLGNGGNIDALSESLAKLLSHGVLETDPDLKKELDTTWNLFLGEELNEKSAELLERMNQALARQGKEVLELRKELALAQRSIDTLDEKNKRLDSEADQAHKNREELEAAVKTAQEETQRLREILAESCTGKRLAEAEEARQKAEDVSAAAEEFLDEQHRELTAARGEILQLRQELARLGSTFTEIVPVEEKEPASWSELLDEAAKLKYISFGDAVEDGIRKLSGHALDRVWVQRTWESLLALEDYARLKQEHGTDELPHFLSYLTSSVPGRIIPRPRYSSSESPTVMNNIRMRKTRIFRVPVQIDKSGYVLMEAHIRIGSGSHPAPRMHFLDDTTGKTGKIHVGYIGPHLKNKQTN